MSNRAWMPLHIDTYLADTGFLTAAEHGAYMLLIMTYWRDGGLPEDERLIARIARMSKDEWAESRDVLASFFKDGWRHSRIDEELAKADEIIEKRRSAAEARHKNRPNPAQAVQVQSKCTDTGVPPRTNNQDRKEEPNGSSKKRGSRLPVDWVLPDEFRAVAVEMGLSPERIDAEAVKMRDWSLSSKAGVKLDWLATWRNWLRSSIERRPMSRASPGSMLDRPMKGSNLFFASAAQDIEDEQRRNSQGQGFYRDDDGGVSVLTIEHQRANG